MIAKVVIIGIILVFLILLLLTILLIIFPVFFGKNKKEILPKDISENVVNQNNNLDDYTLISVITAAIAAYRENIGECGDLSSFKVVAFRKAKRR